MSIRDYYIFSKFSRFARGRAKESGSTPGKNVKIFKIKQRTKY